MEKNNLASLMLKWIKVYFFVMLHIMIVEESMHVVFDETNSKLQDQKSKSANDEDMPQEK